MVFFYNGQGSDPSCSESLKHALSSEMGENFNDVIEGDFSYFDREPERFRSVVIGGGNAFHMGHHLYNNPKYGEALKTHILTSEKGFLGECAGAYLPLSSKVIEGNTVLADFLKINLGAQAVMLDPKKTVEEAMPFIWEAKKVNAFWCKGPYFSISEGSEWKILAEYEAFPKPSIIYKNHIVLNGAHNSIYATDDGPQWINDYPLLKKSIEETQDLNASLFRQTLILSKVIEEENV